MSLDLETFSCSLARVPVRDTGSAASSPTLGWPLPCHRPAWTLGMCLEIWLMARILSACKVCVSGSEYWKLSPVRKVTKNYKYLIHQILGKLHTQWRNQKLNFMWKQESILICNGVFCLKKGKSQDGCVLCSQTVPEEAWTLQIHKPV